MPPRVVLTVEDDDAAFQLLKAAFQETQPEVQLLRANDSEEALAVLRRTGPFAQAPRPGVVLLNGSLPKKAALDVLAEISASESLRSIPVIVLTAPSRRADRERYMALGAQDFLTKPANFDDLVLAVKSASAKAFAY